MEHKELFSSQVLSLHIIIQCLRNENTYSLMLSFLIDLKNWGLQILGSISQFNTVPLPHPLKTLSSVSA